MRAAVGAALVAACTAAALAGGAMRTTAAPSPPPPAPCTLANGVKHVIYLQFDNVHYRRDNPNVASDLEPMPHLLNFLTQNGTLFTNDHTILISHTAGGILSSLTGLYPDRQGQTVSNSYDYFKANGVPAFTSSFKYWTGSVDGTDDPLPNMITDNQKTTPAPWVPWTRAGCDVGGVGTANMELENNSIFPGGDISNVFGSGSPEAGESSALRTTDFVGIAVHCSQAATSVCQGNAHAKPDPLPDEPGGYSGFQALFGAKYVDPAITGGQACVPNTAGQPVTDAAGNCGFPGFDGMLATNTLGYVEQMQENGVPVTYGYISDVHDAHVANPGGDFYQSSATGPGESAHDQQLAAYDQAFQQFFDNLKAHGIDQKNTLFVITVDEGDHFAGGIGTPQPDGSLGYSHTTCTILTSCPTNQIGEVDTNMNALLPTADQNVSGQTIKYDIHFDDAPAFYLTGDPSPTDPTTRRYERDVAALTSIDPYVRDDNGFPQAVNLAQRLADPTELKALHMVNSDPKRTPSFVMFGNPDFYFQLSNCSGVAECASPGFAWNHGDIQDEIGNTWVGFVGPGIEHHGIDDKTWTDHTNVRPTILAAVGLKDDYETDGRVLVEALSGDSQPKALNGGKIQDLGDAYEQINAPFGEFAQDTLVASTRALESGTPTDDSTFTSIESSLSSLISQRDALAGQIKDALYHAAFDNQRIDDHTAEGWIDQANALLSQAQSLAAAP
ncbi:MAG: hypothetical protein JO186_08595 [Actinobacteria bacterium]|nr:hypothetical protein [Actinomycetota bacterium]